jgi:hypothetical protein
LDKTKDAIGILVAKVQLMLIISVHKKDHKDVMLNLLLCLFVPTILLPLINVFIIKKFKIALVLMICKLKKLKINKITILLKMEYHQDVFIQIFIKKTIILFSKLFAIKLLVLKIKNQ